MKWGVIALVVIALFAVSIPMISSVPEESPIRAHISYMAHAPISIIGNAGFLGANASTGISTGSGTVSDPYIIEGWEIDALTARGIEINGTDVFFSIIGCNLFKSGASGNYGVYFNDVQNGTINGNTFSASAYLILDISGNNSIINNTLTANGIGLWGSDNNSFNNNIITTCSFEGIYGTGSNDNIIFENNISQNNFEGIGLYSCNRNRMWNNSFWQNNGATSVYDPAHKQGYADDANFWNTSSGYGNYWMDWQTPDVDNNLIVDNPYIIGGAGGFNDEYPRIPDNTHPIANITATPAYMNSYSIILHGTAWDNVAVSSVVWNNTGTGNHGSATGTTTWSAYMTLAAGANLIFINATDPTGNIGSSNVTIYVDSTAPMINITWPTGSPSYSTSMNTVCVGGNAYDGTGLTSVVWANSRGGSGTAAGTTSWNISSITLYDGDNRITVSAIDVAGNVAHDIIVIDSFKVNETLTGGGGTLPPSVTPPPSLVSATGVMGVFLLIIGVYGVAWSKDDKYVFSFVGAMIGGVLLLLIGI